MDIDADDHGEEGIPLPGMDAHAMQMVIIEYPVVYPFARSAVTVGLLIFLRSPRDRGIEPDVPVRLGVDTAAIGGGGTCFPAGAGSYFTAGKGTAPFTGMLLFTVPPVDHTVTGHTQGSTIFINGDGLGDGFGPAAVHIKVNKRTDIPFLAEPVGSIVVMGGVQAEVPDRDIRVEGLKFTQGDDGADTVMPPGIKETDVQREVNPDIGVMGAEHVERMPKTKDLLVTVPAPVRIRIGEMAFAGAVRIAVF